MLSLDRLAADAKEVLVECRRLTLQVGKAALAVVVGAAGPIAFVRQPIVGSGSDCYPYRTVQKPLAAAAVPEAVSCRSASQISLLLRSRRSLPVPQAQAVRLEIQVAPEDHRLDVWCSIIAGGAGGIYECQNWRMHGVEDC